MSRQRTKPAEERQEVAAWIVSFSDMVTLLLAFFVLLQSFANMRDPELFYAGQGSFKRAIAGLGLPDLLLGKPDRPERDFRKLKYPTEEQEQEFKRPGYLNLEDDRIREAFDDLRKMIDVESSDAARRVTTIQPTPIRFAPSDARLDAAGRQFLRTFAFNLGQTRGAEPMKVYVIGLAAEAATKKQQSLLSAQRAMAVEKVLREALAERLPADRWDVCSWGAGPGGPWSRNLGVIPRQSAIVIALSRG